MEQPRVLIAIMLVVLASLMANHHGNISTFAAAVDETESHSITASCPCIQSDRTFTSLIPRFVGQDYFCDTGNRNNIQYFLMIHSGMVRDVGVPALAVGSTIHRSSASNSLI